MAAENKEVGEGVTITSMREYPHFVSPGKMETLVEVTYKTEAGYEGTVTIPKTELTEEKIAQEIKKALKPAIKLVGKEIKL